MLLIKSKRIKIKRKIKGKKWKCFWWKAQKIKRKKFLKNVNALGKK